MKIGIIGVGYVGSAIKASYDNNVKLLICDPRFPENISIDQMISEDPSAIFVSVPTPTKAGKGDYSILDSVFQTLECLNYRGLVISKSTASPDFYENALKKYNFKLTHVPEFLKEVSAVKDYLNPECTIIGGNPETYNLVLDVLKASKININTNKIFFTEIKTAAVFKYVCNTFLATKVIYANELYLYCKAINVDWNSLQNLLVEDSRLGSTHWKVPGADNIYGYGGNCFPKDIDAMIYNAKENGVNMTLLKHVRNINNKIRNHKFFRVWKFPWK